MTGTTQPKKWRKTVVATKLKSYKTSALAQGVVYKHQKTVQSSNRCRGRPKAKEQVYTIYKDLLRPTERLFWHSWRLQLYKNFNMNLRLDSTFSPLQFQRCLRWMWLLFARKHWAGRKTESNHRNSLDLFSGAPQWATLFGRLRASVKQLVEWVLVCCAHVPCQSNGLFHFLLEPKFLPVWTHARGGGISVFMSLKEQLGYCVFSCEHVPSDNV